MKKPKKRKVIGVLLLLAVLAILIPTAAWFSVKSEKDVSAGNVEILAPYRMYLKDSSNESTFTLSVGNLHPGQILDIPFCVTNDPYGMDVSDEEKKFPKVEFSYELELARTDNIPLVYTLYPATKSGDGFVIDAESQIEGKNITGDRQIKAYGDQAHIDQAFNKGTYTLYTSNDKFELKINNENNLYDYDYYILRVEFEPGKSLKGYEKETDLIYLSGSVAQTVVTTGEDTP